MIQILRLKNGEDIIGEVFTDTGDYEIQQPIFGLCGVHG
jgi:hypothetical protein